MKKIIKYITENIRPPLLILITMINTFEAISQNEKHITANQSQLPASVINACGTYPASGIFVKATSVLNAGNNCNTVITASAVKVYFAANDKIILSPGFTAVEGSNFIAYIKADSLTNTAVQKAAIAQESTLTNEKLNESVVVAPNPFAGSFILSINSKNNVKAQVTIYNSYGAKVKEQTGVNLAKGLNKLSLNCSSFASGVYMIEVNLGNSKILKKIVKTN